MGCSNSPRQYFRSLRKMNREWKKINQHNFNRSIKRLSREKLVEERILSDGSFQLKLTEKGKREAKFQNLIGNSIKFRKPKNWDKKWRIVMFDIPERDRKFREILRQHLYLLNFYKLQQSVFVSPYPFEKEILELMMIYSATPYVRVITAIKIDNEERIKKHFFR